MYIYIMNSQFILNYTGSKFKETKELDCVNFDIYDTIIEPFGGSYGFSRYLYKMRNYKNKKYIIYDNSKELIDFYLYIQDLIKNNKLEDFLNKYQKENDYLVKEFQYYKNTKRITLDGKKAKEYILSIEDKYLRFMLKQNCIRGGIVNRANKSKIDKDFLDMFNNINFIHSDIINIDFTIYDKEKTLLYLDPPYLGKDNSYYDNVGDVTLFYECIMNLFKTNKTILIHTYNFLINFIFKECKYMEYSKKFRVSNSIENQIVYYNYII